jgi:lipid II:glycine glycyltransferase (peptidoglycan interpeptide bridge formation enzyme)
LEYRDWDEYLKSYPDVHILQTSSWGEVKASFGWKVSQVMGENAGAQILFKKIPAGFSWGYIGKGPVGKPDDRFWSKVNAECQRHRAVFLKIEPDLIDDEKTLNCAWVHDTRFRRSPHMIQPRRTIVVDLRGDQETLLGRMKQKTRYNIRLAERKGVKIRYGEDVDQFFRLLRVTGERDEFGIHSQAYYQKVYELFSEHDSCAIIFSESEEKILSAAMVFKQGSRAWYFYGASSDEQRNLMAPYAVQWEAMLWARSKGCTSYDLWGVPDEDLERLEAGFSDRNDGLWGVYRFKRGFGGRLIRSSGALDIVYKPVLYNLYLQWMKKRGF